jgi:predicted amidohydrolase YtcJ
VSEPQPAPRYRDAHTHLAAGAADLSDLDLRGVRTGDEVLRRVAEAARDRARGAWVRGWGWDGAAGDTSLLDHAAPDHPVFLARRDGHAAWINRAASVALELADDAVVLDEHAFEAAHLRLPPPTSATRARAVEAQLQAFTARGIVSLDDFIEPWTPSIYAGLAERGRLVVRIGMWLPETIDPHEARALRESFPPDAEPIAVRGVKLFLDGTLGARTAALSEPYADDPGNRGTLRITGHGLVDRVNRWASQGWPIAVHAIGDRAVTLALDVLEAAPAPAFGAHRIEHAQVVRHADLPRFAAAGIVASVQPGHWLDDRPFLDARLGRRTSVIAHPLASLARAGASLVFGSDWPVSSFDPDRIIAAAIHPARGPESMGRDEAVACASA